MVLLPLWLISRIRYEHIMRVIYRALAWMQLLLPTIPSSPTDESKTSDTRYTGQETHSKK
jgi:hypothetical protein